MLTRFRNRSDLQPFHTAEERIYYPNCSFSSFYEYDSYDVKSGRWKEIWDTVTPNFRKRVAAGEVIINPLSIIEKDVFNNGGNNGEGTISGYTCSGSPPILKVDGNYWYAVMARNIYLDVDGYGLPLKNAPSSDVSNADLSSAIREASTSVQSKVASGDAQVLEDMAQFGQAMDLFTKPLAGAQRLTATFLKVLQNRKQSTGKSFGAFGSAGAKFVSGEWLKYRYGILPIINDMKAIMETLAREAKKVRKTEHASVRLSGSSSAASHSPSGDWNFAYTRESHTDVLVRATSIDEYFRSFQTDLGLSIDQIPRTAWNIIPFSFVVDWFVNVDDFINALVPKAGVRHLGGCITVDRTTTTWFYTTGASSNTGNVTLTRDPSGSINIRYRRKDRSVGLPAAALRFKSDFRFSKPKRVLDALALTTQNVQRISNIVGSII